MMHTLKIQLRSDDAALRAYYEEKVNKVNYDNDCGVDIIFPTDQEFEVNRVTLCNMGIACEFIPHPDSNLSGAFDLVPRSSISGTPLMLANNVGIIDPGYRGEIKCALRCFTDRKHLSTLESFNYKVTAGTRLIQLCAPDRNPIRVELVDELSETARGDRGFGSTDQKIE